jgi:hypothetical protein
MSLAGDVGAGARAMPPACVPAPGPLAGAQSVLALAVRIMPCIAARQRVAIDGLRIGALAAAWFGK